MISKCIYRFVPVLWLFCVLAGSSQEAGYSSWDDKKLIMESGAHFKTNDFFVAEVMLTELIKRQPTNINFFVGRAGTRIGQGNPSGAIKDFEAIQKLNTNDVKKITFFVSDRMVWKARELSMQPDKKTSLRIYDAILTISTNQGMLYMERGVLKYEMTNYVGALADLDMAIKIEGPHNQFGDSYTHRAKVKEKLGDKKGAEADLKMADKKAAESEMKLKP